MRLHYLFRALFFTVALILVVSTGQHVRASYDLIGWHAETIGPGPYSSLALDRLGQPRVVSWDGRSYAMRYAVRDEAGWHETMIDNYGGYPSLALDSADQPHIIHRYGHWLNYLYRDSTGWQDELVAEGVSSNSGLVIDGQGRVHLAYVLEDEYGGQVIYAVRQQGVWHTQSVFVCPIGLFDGCGGIDIALSPAGRPSLAFFLDDPSGLPSGLNLMFASLDGSDWVIEEAFPVLDLWDVRSASMAIDGSGRPHVSYYGLSRLGGLWRLNYAYRDTTGWHAEMVAIEATEHDLAVSDSGVPHLVFYVRSATGAKGTRFSTANYAYRDSTGWHSQTLDTGSFAGLHSSIALFHGYPAAAYYHSGAQRLRYVFQTAIDIQPSELPNLIDPSGTDKVTVIVMGTGELDVRTIDPLSATLGPAEARPAGGHYLLQDADLDGDIDLTLAFRIPETGIPCGATTAVLTARTNDGRSFSGSDTIETINCY
jgi:hypothetical protein